jgi:hypothetical protein
MAQLISPFNPNNYNPEQSAGQLPLGKHPVVIESSEVKANKANDGGYLQFNLKIIDGPNAGITGPYRLNLYHADDWSNWKLIVDDNDNYEVVSSLESEDKLKHLKWTDVTNNETHKKIAKAMGVKF